MKPLHTIIIITYNQENLIVRALESILCQKEFVYEIVISDDCSTDKTWEVIQEYQKTYPDIIKPFRNPVNLGIFGNIESTYDKTNGEIIWFLSGDDEFCNGLFEEANKLIDKHDIDLSNDAITLYFDYMAISPQGKETIYRNCLVEKYNPISLKIRQLICNRTVGFSKNVFNNFYPVPKDIGIMADGLIDIQVQLFSDRNYYSSFVGSKYYSSIGVSIATKRDAVLKSYILSLEQLKTDIKNLSRSDLVWLIYLQKHLEFSLTSSNKNYLSYLKYFIRIIRKYYGWSFLIREFKRFIINTLKVLSFWKPQ